VEKTGSNGILEPCPVLQDEIVEEEPGCGGDKERAGFAAEQDPITDDPTMIAIGRRWQCMRDFCFCSRLIAENEIVFCVALEAWTT